MGHGIAIPHGRLLALDDPLVVLARHQRGVPFGRIDNEPSRIIVPILSGARDPDAHVKLLGAIAQLLSQDDTRQAILTARNPEQVLEIIRAVA